MNRKAGCLGLLLAPLVLYGVWVIHPPSRHEAQSRSLIAENERRHKLEQAAPDNAFLDPQFLPYWGRKSVEYRKNSPVEVTLNQIHSFSDLRQGKETGLDKRFNQPAVKKIFKGCQPTFKHLHKLTQNQHFVISLSEPADSETEQPELLSLRTIAQCYSAYIEYLVAGGQTESALSACVDSLRFSRLAGHDQINLLRLMISIACQTISQTSLAMTLNDRDYAGSLEPVLQGLRETHVHHQTIQRALESEYVMMLRSLQKDRANSTATSRLVRAVQLPGVWGRELRMFKNDFLDYLQQSGSGTAPNLAWAQNPKSSDWLLGRHTILSAILLPNFPKSDQQVRLLRTRQAFLYAFVGLLQARHEKGEFPANLQELVAGGFRPLDGLDINRLTYKVTPQGFELALKLVPAELPSYAPTRTPGMEEWQHLMGPSWLLKGR